MSKNNAITENELIFDVLPGEENQPQQKNYLQQLDGQPLKSILADIEKDIIIYSLEKNHGNVVKTVKQLEIGKTAFYDKLKRYSISPKEHK